MFKQKNHLLGGNGRPPAPKLKNAYLLVDDFFHDRINKASEKAAEKMGCSKKTVAIMTFSSAMAIQFAFSRFVDPNELFILGQIAITPKSWFETPLPNKEVLPGLLSFRDIVAKFAKIMRLPVLIISGVVFMQETFFGSNPAAAVLLRGMALAGMAQSAVMYMISPGTGLYQSFKEKLAEARKPAPAVQPVPVSAGD